MIIALDLETTGLDNRKDKIIEVALVAFDETTGEIIDTFSTLLNPQIHIPELNSNITGIYDEDVKNAPFFDDQMKNKISDFIGKSPILGHNTYFDRDFLIQNGIDLTQNTVLDTFVLANFLLWEEKSLNLGSLCESLGIPLTDAHRALDDTLATYKVFLKLRDIFASLSQEQKSLLQYVFSKCSDVSFEFYLKYFDFGEEKRLTQDTFIQKILSHISPYKAQITPEPDYGIFPSSADGFFEKLPNFEVRENQHQMTLAVEKALFENKKLVIEAPTGVGKTFAYSIPSVYYALKTGENIVISTHTKALQDQIFYKDLVLLEQNLGVKFTYTKLKGKKNYISVAQFFEHFLPLSFYGKDEASFFAKIVLWIIQTQSGELDEMSFYPKEFQILKDLHADHFLVLSEENEYKNYEFLFKARSHAQNADIIVVNHSLLLQDTKSKTGVLPEFKNLIIDEAHNLEDTTTQALKKSFTMTQFYIEVQKLLSTLQKQQKMPDNLENIFADIGAQLAFAFDIFSDYVRTKNTYSNEVFECGIEGDFFLDQTDFGEISQKTQALFITAVNKIATLDDKAYSSIRNYVQEIEDYLNIFSVASKAESLAENILIFTTNVHLENTLSYTLLHPGKFLEKNLYNELDSLVITSATLQIDHSFDYFSSLLYWKDDFEKMILKSDFDYAKQSLLFVPNDLGSARYNNPVMYQFILDFLKMVGGKSLVLLTSFTAIKEMYLFLNSELKKAGVSLLPQSIGGSKQKILNHYKKNYENSVILGTDSFWEGVDFPGEELKYLIIHKFPFDVPSDPVFKARSKLFKDAFSQYSVPKAIIKTKQGFGRLIRTKNDSGIVIVLDERMYQSGWGERFYQAFPDEINKKLGNSAQFLQTIHKKSQQ